MGGERRFPRKFQMADDGSSPRGRGTPVRRETCRACGRFIPAWAGNADLSPLRQGRTAVHPRVGGERPGGRGPGNHLAGSSPRGRGTLCHCATGSRGRRFIPAWAGNAQLSDPAAAMKAVHPRVGGERTFGDFRLDGFDGSSPRGRGTRVGHGLGAIIKRFIPAWAGNATTAPGRMAGMTVHPRVGGERPVVMDYNIKRGGSSPRGRGTPGCDQSGGRPRRFIPAWAGNATRLTCRRSMQSVHPRVGGERHRNPARLRINGGSSPRGRGTRSSWRRPWHRSRFIPAWAGNALAVDY